MLCKFASLLNPKISPFCGLFYSNGEITFLKSESELVWKLGSGRKQKTKSIVEPWE